MEKYKIINNNRYSKNNIWNKKKYNPEEIKITWVIEFYFKEEIKNDEDKNIFFALSENGMIFILLIYFKKIESLEIEEHKEPYKLINKLKIESFIPIKIIKLKKLFKEKENDNYFLVNSMKSKNNGKAIIINVIENNSIDIEKKIYNKNYSNNKRYKWIIFIN